MGDYHRQARVKVSKELLAEMLFPPGTEILAVQDENRLGFLTFYVLHPDLRESLPGDEIPWADPVVSTETRVVEIERRVTW